MTDKPTPEPTRPDVAEPAGEGVDQIADSPGRLIRQARERVQMSLDELAAQTKLSRSTLEALERDDFKVLRESVYVRGYYRKCCKCLTLSEETLIAAYQRLAGKSAQAAPSKLLLVSDGGELIGGSRGGSMRWWITLVVIVAILVAIYWYLHNRASLATPPAVVPSPTATVTPSSESQGGAAKGDNGVSVIGGAGPAGSASVVGAEPGAPDEMTQPSASTPAATPAGQPDTTAQSASAPAAASQSLTLDFKGTSWVRIEDADGKMLLTGVIQAGATQVLTGKPPFSVFLGNAPGVNIEYQGRQVDMQPYVKDNSTARFSVPQG